jgi:hypothetical protein
MAYQTVKSRLLQGTGGAQVTGLVENTYERGFLPFKQYPVGPFVGIYKGGLLPIPTCSAASAPKEAINTRKYRRVDIRI